MRPQDWFGVGVRLLGVWVLFQGVVGNLLKVGTSQLGLGPASIAKEWNDVHSAQMHDLWYAAGFLACSICLIFGAEYLTRWAYKE